MIEVKVKGKHLCPTPGCRVIVSNDYARCYGCEMKFRKVYASCLSHGLTTWIAMHKALGSYPAWVVKGEGDEDGRLCDS